MRMDTLIMNQMTPIYVSKGDTNLLPLKVTALSYLSEALQTESYETMKELVHYAKEFGATPQEVAHILSGDH